MTTKRHVSLASSVAGTTALVIAIAMAAYAAYQYITLPDVTIAGLLLEHSWHVLVLGVLTYVALHALLYRAVVRPIGRLYVKLYAISRGDWRPLSIQTHIREIDQIAESVNLLVSELRKPSPAFWVDELAAEASLLRTLAAKTSNEFDEADRQALFRVADELEGTIMASAEINKGEQRMEERA